MENYAYEGAPPPLTFEFEFGGGGENKHIIKDLHKKVGKALTRNAKAGSSSPPSVKINSVRAPAITATNNDIIGAIESSDINDAIE